MIAHNHLDGSWSQGLPSRQTPRIKLLQQSILDCLHHTEMYKKTLNIIVGIQCFHTNLTLEGSPCEALYLQWKVGYMMVIIPCLIKVIHYMELIERKCHQIYYDDLKHMEYK